ADRHAPRAPREAVPDELSHAKRAAGIARGRLDPEALERSLAQHASVGDAVERHAPSQAKVVHARFPMRRPRHAQHDLLADYLHRTGEVHLALRQLRLWYPRWTAEQLGERVVGHRQTAEVVEVLLVQL